jgi:chromosome segregation ATPase
MAFFQNQLEVENPSNDINELLTTMKSISSDLRRIENQANDQNDEIEVQKKELELTEGRLQKEIQLRMEAEAQLEIMETTLARLSIETKTKAFEIKELDQQKNNLNLELQSLISKNFSEDDSYMRDVIQILETRREEQNKINAYKEQLKSDNLLLIRQKIYERDQRNELAKQINILQLEIEREKERI